MVAAPPQRDKNVGQTDHQGRDEDKSDFLNRWRFGADNRDTEKRTDNRDNHPLYLNQPISDQPGVALGTRDPYRAQTQDDGAESD
jgi:hypothetical protein